MADIEIEIDDRKIQTHSEQMIIQVADEAGIYIPRFCYHKHLPVAANCRMCLVEVEKSPKALPACATPITPGMKVFTKSTKAMTAQRSVMEFLLINHPLDCPICDQGGECELQDLTMGFASPLSHFAEGKRAVKDEDIGPLVATEMTRCIQCTRCVRFGEEVAGLRELGATGRGEHMTIGTYIKHAMHSEVSGNIIDICPVGALTSKPFRFRARAWELTQAPSISPHDCVGSNLFVHSRNGSVMRVVSRENNAVNETWISDRDRFSYAGLDHPERLTQPWIRRHGKLAPATWEEALTAAAQGLRHSVDQHGSGQLGALISPSATLEESYLLQSLVRQLGSAHIDHRLRQVDFRDQATMPLAPGLGMSMAELAQCDAILLIGSHIQKEQPSAALRVRKAWSNGAKIMAVNMLDYHFHFPLHARVLVSPAQLVDTLAEMVEGLEIPRTLRDKKHACILLGALAMNHPRAAEIRYHAAKLAQLTGAKLGLLTEGANAAGAWLAGAVPHRTAMGQAVDAPGLDAQAMLAQPRKAYLLCNVEPELDCAQPQQAITALQHAEFVLALSMFNNATLEKHADVILPITPFTENTGTLVNAAGTWQSFNAAVSPLAEARPGWLVLQSLGQALHLEDFDMTSCAAIRDKVQGLLCPADIAGPEVECPKRAIPTMSAHNQLVRIGDIPIYATDSLVRRSQPLQEAQRILEGECAVVRIHPQRAAQLHITEGEMVHIKQNGKAVRLPAIYDTRLPEDAILIAGGIPETAMLDELFGIVEIDRIT
ncbi:MAG: hypothetical protein A3E83_01175 [Gammaproteobacteria bacterium RIFCSPHIGHO2_12_FULL_41_20]|nr:MAG: hypothetical protein A3E83_01175 [Gammaproteobacteria bacterium RIFCSPHIGHO2_12_FULL_41_20]